jgi:hypothetical protein
MTAKEEAAQVKELTTAVQSELLALLRASGGAVPFANPFEGKLLLDAVQKACINYIGPDLSQLKLEIGEVTPEMRRLGQAPPIYVSGPPELMAMLSGPASELHASDFIDVDVIVER